MRRLSLDGRWQVQLTPGGAWLAGEVPGCWEALDAPKDLSGPVRYRRVVEVPAAWTGRRLWLRLGAVSYHCRVLLNGQELGEHRGAWDGFRLEATDLLMPGANAEVVLEIEKPASLSGGPDSPAVPGRYPTRETLAGFLPYVWGHLFGGPWQSVTLEGSRGPALAECHAHGDDDGHYRLEGGLSDPGEITVRLIDPEGRVLRETSEDGDRFDIAGRLEQPILWSPGAPSLYRVEVWSAEADPEHDGPLGSIGFGFRSLRVDGTTPTLNRMPIYPRMILSWGWYPEALHSNPGRERFRRDMERLKAFGFNGVKLCLWVPPESYFEVADELGMLIWLELPMWLPRPSPAFAEQALREYERIVRQVRHHPSLLIYSLGCELNDEVGTALLSSLYRRVKALIGDALLRDNSGSGEAYGGLLDEFADYYDHHPYSELQHLGPLLDHFAPRWRPTQPWLLGEFCDSDSFRDLRRIDGAFGGRPWWARRGRRSNPQGARWQFDLVDQELRLREVGLWDDGERFERVSYRQSLLQRKATLEQVRSRREVSGYVVTGEADTPISSSGLWDDTGREKFPPASFRAFNDDTVLALGWGRQRSWLAGGDRPVHRDRYSYRAGERLRAHVIVSHYGAEVGSGALRWRIGLEGTGGAEEVVAAGDRLFDAGLLPGTVREMAIVDLQVPELDRPRRARLTAELELPGRSVHNAWPLWFFPRHDRNTLPAIGLVDPSGALRGAEALFRVEPIDEVTGPLLASEWSETLSARVAEGADAVLLASGRDDDPLPSVALPFWREAIKLIEPHPAWADFPHPGWVDLPYYPLATDRALDTRAFEMTAASLRPLLWRLDARSMARHAYACELEVGRGRLLITSLHLAGGHGDQPSDLHRNTVGGALLTGWLRWLHASRSEGES